MTQLGQFILKSLTPKRALASISARSIAPDVSTLRVASHIMAAIGKHVGAFLSSSLYRSCKTYPLAGPKTSERVFRSADPVPAQQQEAGGMSRPPDMLV